MSTIVDIDIFRRFSILNTLEEPLFMSLCKQLTIESAEDKHLIFNYLDTDTKDYFLVKGKVKLIDKDDNSKTIEAGMPNSNRPLSATRPRQHTVIAEGDIEYFVIDTAVLKQIIEKKKRTAENLSLFNEKQAKSSKDTLFNQFEHELNRGYFVLPSFPETALKIKNKVEQEDCEINELVNLIQSDPGLSAKLIKTANSPLYRGVADCNNITAAVMRLGLSTTKQMAMSFAILSLFESDSKLLKQQMEATRKKCIRVACLAFILSQNIANLNQEEALLAGLLYPMGKIIVLTYAENLHELDNNPSELSFIIASLKAYAGQISAEQWEFPQHLIDIAAETASEETGSTLDYYHLINCCKILSLFDIDNLEYLPTLEHSSSLALLYKNFNSKEDTLNHIHQNLDKLKELQQLFII